MIIKLTNIVFNMDDLIYDIVSLKRTMSWIYTPTYLIYTKLDTDRHQLLEHINEMDYFGYDHLDKDGIKIFKFSEYGGVFESEYEIKFFWNETKSGVNVCDGSSIFLQHIRLPNTRNGEIGRAHV